MRRRRELAVAALVLAACSRSSGAPSTVDAAPIASSAPPVASSSAVAAPDADAPPADDEGPFVDAAPKGGRSIGHTSVVFKIELANGKKIAFKPASRRGPIRYKGEIAAYRLGRALGIPNVPPAYFRTFHAGALAAAVGGTDVWSDVLAGSGTVKGAAIPWIEKLDFLPLEKDPLWTKFHGWLKRGAEIAPEDRALARQASILVVFDWLTGNWDRWSGGNVGFDRASGTLLFIDNDGAFFAKPPKDALAKTWRMLEGMDRFSKSFVERITGFDNAKMERALGEEAAGVPLLDTDALLGVAIRRAQLLQLLDAKKGEAGANETLFFE